MSFLCLSWQSYCILLRQLLQVGWSRAPLNYLCSRLELSLSFLLRTNLFILVPGLQDFYVQHIYRPLCNQQGIFVVDILDGHYFLSLHHEILAQVEVISARMILRNHTHLKVYKSWRILQILKTLTIKWLAIFFKKYFNFQGFYIVYIINWRSL